MYRPRFQALRQQNQGSFSELMTLAPNDPAYNELAAELSQQASATAGELITLLTELQSNAYALLNADQQEAFLKLRAERREAMQAPPSGDARPV